MKQNKESKTEVIKYIVSRIGYGISWETAQVLIETTLKNWNDPTNTNNKR